jgi:CubicO group peptidase (beta-lactamase class C family)
MKLTDTLNYYFQDLERQHRFSGVVLITQAQAQVYAAAYGYANRAWHIKNTLAMRFDTASITKVFTAVATLQLIEQGALTFATRVIGFLGLRDTTISKAVTIYHLLTHTSGIGDDADEEAGENYEDLWRTKPNYSVTTTADFLPQFSQKPPNFAPGKGCRYCNVGYVLLGLLIEKATGMTYRDYIRQHIFARAGMQHSDFYRLDRVNEQVAEGCDPLYDDAHNIVAWKKNIYSFPPVGSPDAGAHVTAGDLDVFLRALKAGKLLSAELTRDFITPKVIHHETEQCVVKYGYGLEFYQPKTDNISYYQKEGINAGVSAIMRHYPDQDMNVILLSNMMDGVWQPVAQVHELVATLY